MGTCCSAHNVGEDIKSYHSVTIPENAQKGEKENLSDDD